MRSFRPNWLVAGRRYDQLAAGWPKGKIANGPNATPLDDCGIRAVSLSQCKPELDSWALALSELRPNNYQACHRPQPSQQQTFRLRCLVATSSNRQRAGRRDT